MYSWLYIFDEFKPIDASYSEIIHYLNRDPERLLKLVLEAVHDELKDVKRFRVYNVYMDREGRELLVELLIYCSLGEVSAKIIVSPDPLEILKKYYNYEKSKKTDVKP